MTLIINGKTYEAGELIAHVQKLEQDNAELKCECRRCVYTDCPCVLSDYGIDRNGICDHFKDVFDENAELKEKQKWLGSSTKCWFSNSPCRSCDEHDERLRRLGLCYVAQLTEAKEIIKEFVQVEYADFTNGDYSNELSKVLEQAEKFLKDSEVEK